MIHLVLLAAVFVAAGFATFCDFEPGYHIAIVAALFTSLPAIGRLLTPPEPPNYLEGEVTPTPVERPRR